MLWFQSLGEGRSRDILYNPLFISNHFCIGAKISQGAFEDRASAINPTFDVALATTLKAAIENESGKCINTRYLKKRIKL
jgi:hypothetical protein